MNKVDNNEINRSIKKHKQAIMTEDLFEFSF